MDAQHSNINDVTVQYVGRKQARENFKQEALKSWAEYLETGRHFTGSEVRAWLRTWGN